MIRHRGEVSLFLQVFCGLKSRRTCSSLRQGASNHATLIASTRYKKRAFSCRWLKQGVSSVQLRRELWDEAVSKAYRELRAEFVTALFADPATPIRTPGFVPSTQTALDVVADQLGDARGGVLESLIRLVITCAEGEDPTTRLPAAALIARMAHTHADYHAHDEARDAQ